MTAEMKDDDGIRKAAIANTEENFRYPAEKKFSDALLSRHEKNEKLVDLVFADEELFKGLFEFVAKRVYDEIREEDARETSA